MKKLTAVFFLTSLAVFAASLVSVDVHVTPPQPVAAGGTIHYNATINNEGPDDAADLTFTFTIPSQATFAGLTAPAGWTCTTGATVTCTKPVLGVGSESFVIDVTTPPDLPPSTITATANVSTSSSDRDLDDNTQTVHVNVTPQSDLSVTLAGAPDPVVAGEDLDWTFDVTNHGPSTVADGSVSLPIPAGLTFVSVSAPAGWNCDSSVTCTQTASLAPNGVAHFVVTTHVASSTPSGTTYTATATVSSALDTIPGNDTASDSVTTTASTNVTITKSTTTTSATPGSAVHYDIDVANSGPSDAANVTMIDTLPAELQFVSLTPPASWSCTTPVVGASGTITCTAATLAASATAHFDLETTVSASAAPGTSIVNRASAGGSSDAADAVTIVGPTDVTGVKSVEGPFGQGALITYTIVLANHGDVAQPDNLGDELVDTLPAGLTLVDASADSGTASADLALNRVRWNGAIAADGNVTITIHARITGGGSGTQIANVATIAFDADGNGTNETTRNTNVVKFAVEAAVPALSPMMLALLAALLAFVGIGRRL
ncbi:MAG: DUF11 domain-containing protein [Acidobacteria bacterium]|nr:DUF11 domain-containing protein [Acidobacteriota bacterium]MBV9478362.1 DUF11 domain-containing protein [Acidobacteriota bacterium]